MSSTTPMSQPEADKTHASHRSRDAMREQLAATNSRVQHISRSTEALVRQTFQSRLQEDLILLSYTLPHRQRQRISKLKQEDSLLERAMITCLRRYYLEGSALASNPPELESYVQTVCLAICELLVKCERRRARNMNWVLGKEDEQRWSGLRSLRAKRMDLLYKKRELLYVKLRAEARKGSDVDAEPHGWQFRRQPSKQLELWMRLENQRGCFEQLRAEGTFIPVEDEQQAYEDIFEVMTVYHEATQQRRATRNSRPPRTSSKPEGTKINRDTATIEPEVLGVVQMLTLGEEICWTSIDIAEEMLDICAWQFHRNHQKLYEAQQLTENQSVETKRVKRLSWNYRTWLMRLHMMLEADNVHRGIKELSTIRSDLTKVKHFLGLETSRSTREVKDGGFECYICYEHVGAGSQIVKVDGCPHEYCKDCLANWYMEHDSCPLCRQTIPGYTGFTLVEPERKEVDAAS